MMKSKVPIRNLQRGMVVIAVRRIDPQGADVRPGTMGIVFEETNAYGDGGGPMVRWMNMGMCNIYQGDAVTNEFKTYRRSKP